MKPLEAMREHLARADALAPLALLGALSGAVTGLVIVAFRWLTERGPVLLGLLPEADGFELLDPAMRMVTPIVGALGIGVLLTIVAPQSRGVGVVHVMERLARHSGRLPWRNAVVQFVGAALAVVSGHSVGREGPVIHVGAASSSLVGEWLRLPNNSLRVLVACGAAAGIAASFDTPLAGVIFAMEVVMMEYSLVGFTPVIVASVTAVWVERAIYGLPTKLTFPGIQMISLLELPFMVLVGVVLGTLSSLFIHLLQTLARSLPDIALTWRLALAGLATSICGLLVPEVMGIGYDTIELALLGSFGLSTLVSIAIVKLIATTACIGFGIPGGLIGPTLMIGASAGGALGIVGHALLPDLSSSPGLYSMLGMGAMMGATLQAPLAALAAILELTGNPNIILPSMVAIVTATLTSRLVFKKESVFVAILREAGLDYRNDPVAVSLARTGVSAVMARRLATVAPQVEVGEVRSLLAGSTDWVLIADEARIVGAVSRDCLAAHVDGLGEIDSLDMRTVPGLASTHATVRRQATLEEALAALEAAGTDTVLVTRAEVARRNEVHGVLDRDLIEATVRYRG